jgi:hypothetical protein
MSQVITTQEEDDTHAPGLAAQLSGRLVGSPAATDRSTGNAARLFHAKQPPVEREPLTAGGRLPLGSSRGDGGATQSDHAAREDEDQEEQEPDQIEDESEVGDDAAEAKRLHEQERAGCNGDPAEPPR